MAIFNSYASLPDSIYIYVTVTYIPSAPWCCSMYQRSPLHIMTQLTSVSSKRLLAWGILGRPSEPHNHRTIDSWSIWKKIIGYRCLENMVFFKMYPIWVLMLLVLLLMREPPSLWRLQGCRRRMALRKRNRTGMDHDMLPVDSTMGPWESLQKIVWQISG